MYVFVFVLIYVYIYVIIYITIIHGSEYYYPVAWSVYNVSKQLLNGIVLFYLKLFIMFPFLFIIFLVFVHHVSLFVHHFPTIISKNRDSNYYDKHTYIIINT